MHGPDQEHPLFSDLALARRLEKAEAHANASFVEARASVFPESGAQWIEVAGAYAMFDTVSSPATQTFGLGLFAPVTSAELERIERFFQERGAPVFHEVSPLAEPGLLTLLNERGYHPIEFTSVRQIWNSPKAKSIAAVSWSCIIGCGDEAFRCGGTGA